MEPLIFQPLSQEVLNDTETWVSSGRRLSDRVWLARQSVRQQIDDRVRLALVNGESPVSLARALEQYLSPSWAPKRNEQGQLEANQPKQIVTRTPNAGAGSYPARRLARTEITRAFGQATLKAAELNPFVEGVKWSLSASHDGSDVCNDNASRSSRGMDRGEYRTDEVPRYPGHPQCKCYLSPVTVKDTDAVIEQLRNSLDAVEAERQADPLAAVYEAARQQFPMTQFNFSGMDADTARLAVKTLQRMADKYPDVAATIGQFGVTTLKPGMGVVGDEWLGVATHEPNGIGLNAARWSPSRVANTTEDLVDSARIGWVAPASNGIESTVVHEFGHLVDRHMSGLVDQQLSTTWLSDGDVATIWKEARNNLTSDAKLGHYAATNKGETFAEAFMQQELGSASLSTATEDVEAMMHELANRKTYGRSEWIPRADETYKDRTAAEKRARLVRQTVGLP